MGQNFDKDDRVSSAKYGQHFGRPKIVRASDLVGGPSMGNSLTDVYPVYARAAAKSPKEEEDEAARVEKRVGIDRPSCNDDKQKGLAGQSDAGDMRVLSRQNGSSWGQRIY